MRGLSSGSWNWAFFVDLMCSGVGRYTGTVLYRIEKGCIQCDPGPTLWCKELVGAVENLQSLQIVYLFICFFFKSTYAFSEHIFLIHFLTLKVT